MAMQGSMKRMIPPKSTNLEVSNVNVRKSLVTDMTRTLVLICYVHHSLVFSPLYVVHLN